MGTFTMRLQEVIDSGFDVWDDPNPYPIFDEAFREALQTKITDHYLFYEIGLETPGMFRLALNRKMREIMPYYNQLYLSEIQIDPLATVDVVTTGVTSGTVTDTTNTNNNTTSDTNSKSRAVTSDTPQTRLAGDEDYATSASDSISEAGATTTAIGSGTQESVSGGNVTGTTKGSQGHAATLLMQYRKSILNIDMNVIQDLESLFMSVWDNGDTFTGTEGIYHGYFHYPIL